MLRSWAKQMLRSLGYELQRLPHVEQPVPPPLLDEPLAAVHLARAHTPAAFRCPVELICDVQGFRFSAHGWHPLVASFAEGRAQESDDYAGSILERYFASFQPANALEALAGFRSKDACGLADLAPHLFVVTPWSGWGPKRFDLEVRRWCAADAAQHGLGDTSIERHGVPYFGPVSHSLGRLEFHRVKALISSLRASGYDRIRGDCRVYLVQRGSEVRAVASGGGRHRIAAMSALGESHVPVSFHPPIALDTRDVLDWPQVRSGVWTRQDALEYVDYLFDFDARQWARGRGLA